MATTDSRLALATLQALTESGIRFALLHGAERIAEEDISDLDVVVDRHPDAVVRTTRPQWRERGLFPIMTWRYDIGGTQTVFLATHDATDGVQLDLLYDPQGLGKYGVRSAALLATTQQGSDPPVIGADASLVYQWRKRSVKGQQDRLDAIRDRAAHLPAPELLALSERLTGSQTTGVAMLGRSNAPPHRSDRHPILEARRLGRRLVHPVGRWAHTESADTATALAARFDRFLVRAVHRPVPGHGPPLLWWVREVVPLLMRPALVITSGRLPRWPRPTIVVGDDADEAARHLVEAMTGSIG